MSESETQPPVDSPSQKRLIFTMSGQPRSVIVINKMRELHPNDQQAEFLVFDTTEELHKALSRYQAPEHCLVLIDENGKGLMTPDREVPGWAKGAGWCVAVHQAVEGIKVLRGGSKNLGERFANSSTRKFAKQIYADFVTYYRKWCETRGAKLKVGQTPSRVLTQRPHRIGMALGIGMRGN